MGKIEKLLEKLQRQPTPADVKYTDLKKVLENFGYVESNKGMTSGSRVKFYHPLSKAVFQCHKPHPGNEIGKATVASAIQFLKEHNHL